MSLIFGTYRLKGEVLEISTSQAIHAMTQAGITSPLIDTAVMYNNELIVKRVLSKHPNVRVGSKVHRATSVAADIAQQVAAYGDRLHRVILHKFMPFEAYLELVKAKARGEVTEIGVSNYSSTELKALVAALHSAAPESLPLPVADCIPNVVQNEFHPFLHSQVPKTCQELGIRFEAHSIFTFLDLYPSDLCEEAGFSAGQLALAFALQRGMGDVVFQTSNYKHLQQNLEPVTVSEDVLRRLDTLVNSKCHARYAGSDSPAIVIGLPNYLDPTHVWFEDCPTDFIRDVIAKTLLDDVTKLRDGALPSQTANAVSKFKAKNPKSVAAFKALCEGYFGDKIFHENPVADFDSKCKKLDMQLTKLRKTLLDHEAAMAEQAKPKVCKYRALEDPEALPVDIPDPAVLQPFIDLVASSTTLPATAIRMERGTLFPDGRMDFCKQVSQPSFEKLCAAVLASGIVKHFLIGNNLALADDTTGSREAALCNLIKLSSGIQTWYLAGNAISATQIKSIAEALVDAPDARYVWLKMNPIKTGAAHLGNLLRRNPRIELLDLFNTGLCDEGITAFADGLEGIDSSASQVKHLYFDINAITEGATVARAAVKFPLLESLSVNVNQLRDAGVITLCKELIRARTPLKRIVLGSNGITDAALPALVELVRALPSLVIVQLGSYKSTRFFQQQSNHLTDASLLVELGQALMQNANRTVTPDYNFLGFQNAYFADDAEQVILALVELGVNANGSQWQKAGQQLVTATSKQLNQILGTPHNVQPGPVEFIQSVYRNAM